MLTIILDTLYYICCFRNKPTKETTPFELILNNLEDLAKHELEYLEGHLMKQKKQKLLCC